MTWQEKKSSVVVDNVEMAYVELGEGDPIVFLHGNPTSSYVWRNVVGHVEDLGRVIAPDLVGMGDSAKLSDSGPGSYRFVDHRRYLDGLLQRLGVEENVILVIQDWGSALGFDWANRHRNSVKGIAYMEAIVQPNRWSNFPGEAADGFKALRSPAGEHLVLEENLFVEQILPSGILRGLSEEEMNEYRRPFAEPGEGRRPTLTWPREIPLDGEPDDVAQIVADYSSWLGTSEVPKLLITGNPGMILNGPHLDKARMWPNQTEVEVDGLHMLQEDSPDAIGEALRGWYLTELSS